MRKFVLLTLLTLSGAAVTAAATTNTATAQASVITPDALIAQNKTASPIIIPQAPDINAKGYVLMDVNSGKVIASKKMQHRMAPASLTKLMTLYVTFQALAQGQVTLDDPVRISKDAWQRGGSRMFLKPGSHVPLRKLIQGIIIASGNDACAATAEYIAGTEANFANLMNQTAARLGMKGSHFVDSTGLPKPKHYSTPHDIALLSQAIITNFPQYYHFFNEKWIKYNGIRQPNRNRLLWRDSSVDGLKTGHTGEAGYCLASSAKRNGMRLLSIVMGARTDSERASDSQALLNWGFRFYKSFKIADANKAITTPRVWLGQSKHVPLGVSHEVYITIPAGEYKNLKASINVQPYLKAPIKQGASYGNIIVTLNNQPFTTVPMIALKGDPKAGFFSRISDHIALFFKKLL